MIYLIGIQIGYEMTMVIPDHHTDTLHILSIH